MGPGGEPQPGDRDPLDGLLRPREGALGAPPHAQQAHQDPSREHRTTPEAQRAQPLW